MSFPIQSIRGVMIIHVLALLLLVDQTQGFHVVDSNADRRSHSGLGLLSSPDRSSVDHSGNGGPLENRRTVLTSIATSLTIGSTAIYLQRQQQQQSPPNVPFGLGNENDSAAASASSFGKNRLLSLDQAFMVLEASCDRRFLHAVVSSDYHFMYRGISKEDSRVPTIISEPSDLLMPSTYDSEEAAKYFQMLDEQVMAKKPIRPSNGHLATTSIDAAKQWGGYAASIWPLDDNVHFAWLEKGGDFWPTTSSSSAESSPSIIVDGVDCGRLSLEDALERDNAEIMFRAERYLAIPVSMEEQLISRLKSSFII